MEFLSNKKCLTAFIAAILVGIVLGSSVAGAAELSFARSPIKLAGADTDSFMISVPPGTSAGELPSAYLFYSKDLSAFAVLRWSQGVAEDEAIDIPAGASMIIPAPPASLIDNHWHHIFRLNGAATDSVNIIPMDR